MVPRFEPVDPSMVDVSPFRLIGDDWMLVSVKGGKGHDDCELGGLASYGTRRSLPVT